MEHESLHATEYVSRSACSPLNSALALKQTARFHYTPSVAQGPEVAWASCACGSTRRWR